MICPRRYNTQSAADDIALAVALTQQAGGWELILWKGIGYVRSLLNCFNDVTIRAEPTLQMTQAISTSSWPASMRPGTCWP